MANLDAVLAKIDADIDNSLQRLFDLVRIESISTDPAYANEVSRAAEWLRQDLASIGFEASVHPTTGLPMVVGKGGEGGPHLLFYGHYDVQPVDPLNLWHRPPFEAALIDGPRGKAISGRGSSDDKGQLMTFVEACRAWVAVNGALPCRLTMFFEGEEESGSPSLVPFMKANRELLTADLALICDTGMLGEQTPIITTQLRGLMGEEIIIKAASRDLHSGAYGPAARNPIRILAGILASLHDEAGRVTLPGFYDGVPELTAEQRAEWDALDFDPEAFLADVGLSIPAGEDGFSVVEQIWARPTCEFNGITGGYTGDGFKTVLPAKASAKVSCRLVGTQDPHAIRAALRARVHEMLPADCSVEFKEHGAAPASVMATSRAEFARAKEALSAEWEKPAAFAGMGGSIPVAGYFKTVLDMDAMLIGFAQDDDSIHSPNEKYDLRSFHKGIRSWARILDALATAS